MISEEVKIEIFFIESAVLNQGQAELIKRLEGSSLCLSARVKRRLDPFTSFAILLAFLAVLIEKTEISRATTDITVGAIGFQFLNN